MTYIDIGQNTQDIGHCKRCSFQWVIPANVKGKRGNKDHTYNGRVCPLCQSNDIRYKKEEAR